MDWRKAAVVAVLTVTSTLTVADTATASVAMDRTPTPTDESNAPIIFGGEVISAAEAHRRGVTACVSGDQFICFKTKAEAFALVTGGAGHDQLAPKAVDCPTLCFWNANSFSGTMVIAQPGPAWHPLGLVANNVKSWVNNTSRNGMLSNGAPGPKVLSVPARNSEPANSDFYYGFATY